LFIEDGVLQMIDEYEAVLFFSLFRGFRRLWLAAGMFAIGLGTRRAVRSHYTRVCWGGL